MSYYQNRNSGGGGSTKLVPINRQATELLKESERIIPECLFNQLFLMKPPKTPDEKPVLYIKAAGAKYRIDELYRNRYEVIVKAPKDYETLRRSIGMENAEFCVIMEAELFIDGRRVSNDMSTATPYNTNPGTKNFPLEIAITRVKRRVYMDVCGGGYASASEDYDKPGDTERNYAEEMRERARKQLFSLIPDELKKKENRGKRLDFLSEMLGSNVETTKTLSYRQIEEIIRKIQNSRTVEADFSIQEEEAESIESPNLIRFKNLLSKVTDEKVKNKILKGRNPENIPEQTIIDLSDWLEAQFEQAKKKKSNGNNKKQVQKETKEEATVDFMTEYQIRNLYQLSEFAGHETEEKAHSYIQGILKRFVDENVLKSLSKQEYEYLESHINQDIDRQTIEMFSEETDMFAEVEEGEAEQDEIEEGKVITVDSFKAFEEGEII